MATEATTQYLNLMTGPAPKVEEVDDLARAWLGDSGIGEEYMQAAIAVTKLAAALYTDVYRKNRPKGTPYAQSVFWHAAEVARHVHENSNSDLGFIIGIAHDIPEDSLKLRPEKPISVDDIVAQCHVFSEDKFVLREVLNWKTDAPELHSDQRRGAQLEKVELINKVLERATNPLRALAAELTLTTFGVDKLANTEADLHDLRAGRLRFRGQTYEAARLKALEYVLALYNNEAIVENLRIHPRIKRRFRKVNKELATRITRAGYTDPTLLEVVGPARQEVTAAAPAAAAKLSVRPVLLPQAALQVEAPSAVHY